MKSKVTYLSSALLATTVISLYPAAVTKAADQNHTGNSSIVLTTGSATEPNDKVSDTIETKTSEASIDTAIEKNQESAKINSAQETSKIPHKEEEKKTKLTTLDDGKVQAWITKHQFQFVQTLFRTDIEGKEIHANVSGYQAPYDLTGYRYLSTIATTTDQGPALVHIYQDPAYADSSIMRTEYLNATSGKKIQADQKGQAFQATIGELHYYNGLVVEENGEKIYKIFYLSDADYVAYAGSHYYVRLTDYTIFVDKATGQEISLRQDGFVPIFEIAGYRYVAGEMTEKDGKTYFVQYFEKGETDVSSQSAKQKTALTEDKSLKSPKKVEAPSKSSNKAYSGLPFTGERHSKVSIIGAAIVSLLALGAMYLHLTFSKDRRD